MISILIPILTYGGIGIISGFPSGLLGIGGETVIAPLLFYLSHIGLPEENVMQCAIATSLASMVFTLLSSATHYYRSNCILIHFIKNSIIGVVLGSILGSLLTAHINENTLEIIFGIFLILVALKTSFLKKNTVIEKKLPDKTEQAAPTFLISCIAIILGIGRGVMLIPHLKAFYVERKKAFRTACAISAMIALLSSTWFLLFGKINVECDYTARFIYLPAFLPISITSHFSSKIGVKTARYIKDSIASAIFSAYTLTMAIVMIL
jgi:uncharacterized membrane protein YfcA